MSIVKMCCYKPQEELILSKIRKILQVDLSNEIATFDQNDVTYTIKFKSDSEKYVFLVSYGKNKPNRCYNRKQNEYDDNVLSDDIIHMLHQFIFTVYNDRILCSNHSKRNVIFNYLHGLNEYFSCELLAEAKSLDDFVNDVKSIETISISATNDLFLKEFLNPSWDDDFDEKESPETTTVTMSFRRALKSDYIKGVYKKLREKSYIKSFDISGETEEGLLSINETGVIRKKSIILETEEGNYDLDEIFIKI